MRQCKVTVTIIVVDVTQLRTEKQELLTTFLSTAIPRIAQRLNHGVSRPLVAGWGNRVWERCGATHAGSAFQLCSLFSDVLQGPSLPKGKNAVNQQRVSIRPLMLSARTDTATSMTV